MPEDDVLPDAEPLDERKVLVDQPDAPVAQHLAGIGAQFSRGDSGERRFSRTVLTDQCVNLTGLAGEIDIVEHLKLPVSLRDSPEA